MFKPQEQCRASARGRQRARACPEATHSPAHGALDQIHDGTHVGSWSISSVIDVRNVLAHIHGHVHGTRGYEGRHFNVAAAAERRAMLIELPSLAAETIEAAKE